MWKLDPKPVPPHRMPAYVEAKNVERMETWHEAELQEDMQLKVEDGKGLASQGPVPKGDYTVSVDAERAERAALSERALDRPAAPGMWRSFGDTNSPSEGRGAPLAAHQHLARPGRDGLPAEARRRGAEQRELRGGP